MTDPGPEFAAAEPRVGEIRVVRTFRVGAGGVLFPLFDGRAWVDGTNTARCRAPEAVAGHGSVPDDRCTCGFYGYADATGATEYPQSRDVLAVVSCWGRVIAGTRGVRSQYARVEALWLSSAVPAALAAQVAAHYPTAAVAPSRTALLEAWPPDILDGYEPRRAAEHGWRARRLAALLVVLLGLVPASAWPLTPWAGVAAAGALGAVVLIAARPRRVTADAGDRRWRLLCFALGLWVLAPQAGLTGRAMLQVPVAAIALLGAGHQYAERRRARIFPARVDDVG